MSRPLVVTALLAAALGSATTAWLSASADPPHEEEPLPLRLAGAGGERPRARPRPRVSLRPRITEEEERELPGLHGRVDVEAYLDRLVARARAQGRVTAVEVEPGMSAIFALRSSMPEGELLAMADDFDARMQSLSAELGAIPRPPSPDLDEALAALRDDDPLRREEAIERALEAIEPLDEPARLEAEARLDEALRGREEASRLEPEDLRAEIDAATDPDERDLAVRRYVEAVENLPREEAEARLADLERGEMPGTSLL
ncbi:MAG: hypothetical protein H6712_17755 [Myxococcales bacterium]|nr:hypothetical protein [Myxococcales bacterium]